MQKVELKNYVDILSGFAFNSQLFNDVKDGMPLIRIRDVGKNFSKTFYPGSYDEKFLVKKGDYLIGMDGDFRLSEWLGENALLNQRVCKISIAKPKELNDKYLLHFLPKELKLIEDSTSYATVKHLSVDKIKKIQIPLPSLPTQQRIAEILDTADQLRQYNKQLIEKYDALTQSLFLEMFGDPVRNEKGWKKKEIVDFINPDRPITYGILMPKDDVKPLGIPYIKVIDVKDGLILDERVCHTTENIESKYVRSRLRENDLLISIRGHVGRICVVPKKYVNANITQDTARLDFNKEIEPLFAEYCLGSIEFQRYMSKYVKGAGVKGINLGDLKRLLLIAPDINIQKKFSLAVLSLKYQKEIAQKSLTETEALFQSLLQRAFKGELN